MSPPPDAPLDRVDVSAPCVLCGDVGAETLFVKHGYRLVRCPGCGLVFVANPPSPVELRKIYSFDAGYHAHVLDDARERRQLERRAEQQIELIARFRKPGRLLDVGCSFGFFLDQARRRGWTTVGVEPNDDTAGIARRRFGLEVQSGLVGDAGLEAGSFDCVTLWDVVEHVPDPVALMATVRGLLAAGGLVAITTPDVGGLFPQASLKAARMAGAWPHPEPPHHLFQFSERTLGRLLRQAALAPVWTRHERIPLAYTFGGPRRLIADPRRLAYALAFAPLALLGPAVGRGDAITVLAVGT